MKLTQNSLYLGLLVSVIASLSAFFSISPATDMAIAFYAIAAIMLIYLGRAVIGNYSNFTVVFLTFSALYSLSGPIAARYGGGLQDFYPRPYLVGEFLLQYSLAVVALAIGLMLVASFKSPSIDETKMSPSWSSGTLLMLAYAIALLASLTEIVNLMRGGGLETLFAGKAAYQSAISELPLDIPSQEIMLLSPALLGLALSVPNIPSGRWKHALVLWLACSAPLILFQVTLGDRRELLSIAVIFVVGYRFFRPLERIELKWIAILLLFYLIMGFLYGIRGYLGHILTTGDLDVLRATLSEPKFWATALNPASNEFGCTFGNFNTYILSGTSDLHWGETYLRGLTSPIPRIIWPDKPQMIGFDFRDTFFPQMLEQGGTIAGTAYSSILEAYVNFGTIGVFVVYLVMALAMGCLERIRSRSRSLMFAIFYLTLLPEAIIFHRNDFGNPMFWSLLFALVGSGSYILIISMFKKTYPIRDDG
jgi:hypothetical protein